VLAPKVFNETPGSMQIVYYLVRTQPVKGTKLRKAGTIAREGLGKITFVDH
jgi:hypothetical protein